MRNLINHLQIFIIVCLLSLLNACAILPASQKPLNQLLSWPARQNLLSSIEQWKIEGAIAIQAPQKSFSAAINWNQNTSKDQYSINLFGPLGIGAVSMHRNSQQFTLQTSNQQIFTAKNPEQLMQEQLGWRLPVSSLYYWIRGLPNPHIAHKKHLDKYNHLLNLSQQGWEISYKKYTNLNNIDLPNKIFLSYKQLKLKIVISNWTLK